MQTFDVDPFEVGLADHCELGSLEHFLDFALLLQILLKYLVLLNCQYFNLLHYFLQSLEFGLINSKILSNRVLKQMLGKYLQRW